MKNNQQNIFDYGNPDQRSYPLKSFCSAALKSLKKYALYEQEVKAADEKNLVFRTTFHPDSDYSTFVGCYKPTTSNG